MIRRGCLIGLLGILGGLGVIGVGVDTAARHYATSRVEQRIRASAPEAHGVRARILGWPFLKVAVNGHVDRMTAHLDRVVERGLAFTNVEIDLRGIKIDQSKLVSEGKVTVQSIRTGTITVSITAGDLGSAIGIPVSVSESGFAARGTRVRVTVNQATRTLAVGAAGLPGVSLPLPGPNLLPCLPSVTYTNDAAVLSCTFTQVPAAFTNG